MWQMLIYIMSSSRVPGKQDMLDNAGTQKLPVLFRFGSVRFGLVFSDGFAALLSECVFGFSVLLLSYFLRVFAVLFAISACQTFVGF